MPDHDLHLLPRGTATRAEGWAAVWYRCGFTLQTEGVKQPHLTLLHGEGNSPPEGIPSLVVKSSPTGTPESWRAHFSPLLEDYSRDAASFLNRHMERRTDTIWALDFDVAAFAEGILKGWHEQADSLDSYGRVIPDASLLARHNLLDRPVLDEICHQFSRIISDLTSVKPPPVQWWFMPTLDLDSSGLFRRRAFPSYLRRVLSEKPGVLPQLALDGLRTSIRILKDPHLRHRQIGEILEGLGFHGAFFSQTNRWHHLDNYDLRPGSEMVRDLKAILENRFHDVGLHSSYGTLDRGTGAWRRQWRNLRTTVGKVNLVHRSHYLRFPVGDPWPSPAGRVYMDSSLGYGGREGFRRGTAFPFPLGPNVVELAPVVMDSTLIHHRAMTPDQAWETCIRLLERVKTTGGAFVPIWHPNNMDDYLFPGWGEVLYDLCREAARRGALSERPGLHARKAHEKLATLAELFT